MSTIYNLSQPNLTKMITLSLIYGLTIHNILSINDVTHDPKLTPMNLKVDIP